MRRASLIACAILLPTIMVLVLAEIGVRYYYRLKRDDGPSVKIYRKSSDPALIFEMSPGTRTVRGGVAIEINSSGFRDDEFPAAARRDAWRIVLLGDSVAWGFKVPMESAFPQVLERKLRGLTPNDRASPIVYNLAVTGYSTAQEIRLLETRGVAFEPDLIIVSYVLNDPEVRGRAFISKIELIDLGSRALTKILDRLRGYPREYHHLVHARNREQTMRQFRRLGEISRSRRIPILVAVTPVFQFKSGKSYEWQDLHDLIGSLCEENGLAFLDLYSAFRGRDSAEYGLDMWHPTIKGHALIAEAISTYLADSSLRK
jgi:lysophospholipase L1-like esterase